MQSALIKLIILSAIFKKDKVPGESHIADLTVRPSKTRDLQLCLLFECDQMR